MPMFPVLFSLGPITIYSYGVFLVLAFLVTSYIFWRKGREEHYAEDELFDAFLLSLIVGMVASRIGFVALYFNHFGLQPLKWIDVFSAPGTVPVVGLLAGGIYLYRYAKRQKWNTFQILDYAALALAGGSVMVWLGNFFAGSDFGNPSTLPWALNFPGVFDRHHPTQLYAALMYLGLYLFLSWAEYHYRTFEWYRDKKHSAQTGFLFCVYCMAYGLIGIVLARLSPAKIVVFGYALDLPVRMIILIFGLAMLYRRSGRTVFAPKKSGAGESGTVSS